MTDQNDDATQSDRQPSSDTPPDATRLKGDSGKARAVEADDPNGDESEKAGVVATADGKANHGEAEDSEDKDRERADANRPTEPPEASGGPRRMPIRWLRGGIPFLLGAIGQFCLVATKAQFRWGVPAGIVATAICVWGLLDLLGSFDDPDERVAHRVGLTDIWPMLAATLGTLLLTLFSVGLAVSGHLPIVVNAVLVPASFLGLIISVYRLGERLGAWATDEAGWPRAMTQRHGFWVVVAGTGLYLPMLGSYALSDPWETHYGEVAREILARNDWISTWWAQDGWFWSKPVLNFWTEALSMSMFGAGYQPDQMLMAVSHGRQPWPEWAIRLPVFIFTIIALYFIYKAVANVFGRRAGFIGAIVLSTMPHWFFIAHQTMTDMPFVAAMTTSMALLLLGLHTDPDREVRVYELGLGITRFRLSGYHLVFGMILMAAVPQVLLLLSRNLELMTGGPWGFRAHGDAFFAGSAVNCGLPGNQNCVAVQPVNKDVQPALQSLLWIVTSGLLLWLNRKERRLSRLLFLAAWFFAAVSTMGKGPAGFLLPALCAGAYIFATGKWKRLLELEFISGLLIILSVAIPWFVAMYMRHGQQFTDRLLFHDMWKRAIVHVHDTNAGVDVSFRYYVWQLGYALFPWTGLVPVGLMWWMRRREDAAGSGRGDVSVFLAMWFVFAFALFTAMMTKFHHYILPAVPPAAMLTGIVLDRMLGVRPLVRDRGAPGYALFVGGGTLLTVYGVFRLFPGTLAGYKPEGGDPREAMAMLGVPVALVGIAAVVAGIRMFGAREEVKEPEGDAAAKHGRLQCESFEDSILGAMGLGAAVVVAIVGFDLANKPSRGSPGQATLLYLFTYNYNRSWPDSLDFSGMIAAFAWLAVALMILLAVRRYRHHVVAITLIVGYLWAAWALDIFMVKTAPHWGQREIIAAYYAHRSDPSEQIVAYQMNWKGENFYTGNRIPAFVSSGADFKKWIEEERKRGAKVMYFVTEHGRSRSLKNELGSNVTSFKKITEEILNNKFAIFRVEFAAPSASAEPRDTSLP